MGGVPGCGDHVGSGHPVWSGHLLAPGRQAKQVWVLPPRARGYSRKTDLKPVMKNVNRNGHSCYLEACGVRESEPRRGFGGAFLDAVSPRCRCGYQPGRRCKERRECSGGAAGSDAGRSDEGGRPHGVSPCGHSAVSAGRGEARVRVRPCGPWLRRREALHGGSEVRARVSAAAGPRGLWFAGFVSGSDAWLPEGLEKAVSSSPTRSLPLLPDK